MVVWRGIARCFFVFLFGLLVKMHLQGCLTFVVYINFSGAYHFFWGRTSVQLLGFTSFLEGISARFFLHILGADIELTFFVGAQFFLEYIKRKFAFFVVAWGIVLQKYVPFFMQSAQAV